MKGRGASSAQFELLLALSNGISIVVLDEREIRGVKSGTRLAELIMRKWRYLKTHRSLCQATDEELSRPEFRRGLREAIRAERRSILNEFLAAASGERDTAQAIQRLEALARPEAAQLGRDDQGRARRSGAGLRSE